MTTSISGACCGSTSGSEENCVSNFRFHVGGLVLIQDSLTLRKVKVAMATEEMETVVPIQQNASMFCSQGPNALWFQAFQPSCSLMTSRALHLFLMTSLVAIKTKRKTSSSTEGNSGASGCHGDLCLVSTRASFSNLLNGVRAWNPPITCLASTYPAGNKMRTCVVLHFRVSLVRCPHNLFTPNLVENLMKCPPAKVQVFPEGTSCI